MGSQPFFIAHCALRITLRACLTAAVFAAVCSRPAFPESALKLSDKRQKIVDRYMNVLIEDARNEFAFREVYGAFKAEEKEFLLVNFFQNAIRLEPDKAAYHIILGKLYAAFRDLYQAGVKFKDAARLAPKDYYARYLLADVWLRQRKYQDAAQEFRVAAALASDMNDRVRSLHGLARVHAALEAWDDARKTWEEVAELRPYDVKSFRELADVARSLQRWDLAGRWLNKLLELLKEDAEGTCFALIDLGAVAFERKEYDKAVEHYRKAKTWLSESHWMSEELNSRIRACFEEQKKTDALRKELEARAAKDPRDIVNLLEIAELRLAEGDLQGAADHLQKASEASPRDVQILEKHRSAVVQLQDDRAVADASKRLVALSPQNVHYKLQDADYHVSRGNRDQAKAVWDAVIEEDKTQPVRYLSVARAMKRSGELDWAEGTYRKLIEVDPDIEAHKIELAELYLRRAEEPPPVAKEGEETAEGAEGEAKDDPAVKAWMERTEAYQQKARELLTGASKRGNLVLAEAQWAGQLLLGHRQLDAAKEILEQGRKRFATDMGLTRMLSETCLRLGATEKSNSKEQNVLYDQAVDTALEAYDLAPHSAIQREMNSELTSLCLGYGVWRRSGKTVYRGGPKGLTPLLKKHVLEYIARPNDPMPAWCIGDIQQQAPVSYFNYKVAGGPPKGVGIFTGDSDRAKAGLNFFSESLQRDPLFVPGYLGKAVGYVMRDSFEQAVVELRKASVVDPVNKWKYFLRIGDLFADQGQMEEAMAFWGRVAERVFTDATVFFQLGTRYFRAERTDEALSMLKRAIEANPNIHSYHMTLGNMYDYLGDYPTAVNEYRQALELSTQSMLLPVRQRLSEIQRSWAYELFDEDNHPKALEQFLEIRAFQEVLEKYYRGENDERALARLSPESANVQAQIARCYEALGRPEEAKPIYEQVANRSPAAPVRLSNIRNMSLRYFTQLKKRMGRLKPDNTAPAGTVKARPFKLRLLRHTRLHDIAREHSVTPNGVLYSGLAKWVEVDPLSGRVLRQMPPQKAIRYREGVEVQALRVSDTDRLRITRDGKTVDVTDLNVPRVSMTDLVITPERAFVFTLRPYRIAAIDTKSGKVVWQTDVSARTQEIGVGDKYVAGLESWANLAAVSVRETSSGKEVLKKKLPGEGLWLQPAVWGDKLFLVEDTEWKLHMLDIATGEFDYSIKFHGTFPRPPVLRDGVLYLHVRAYKERSIYLYAIQPDTGQMLWRSDMKAMSVHSPPIFRGPDIVYLNPETHRVFMIDRETGVRHAEASYESLMTKQQRDYLQFMRPFREHLLMVGGRGSIHAFEVVKD